MLPIRPYVSCNLRKALRRHADDSRNWSGVHKLEGAGHADQRTRLDLSRPRGLSYFLGDGQRSASLVRRSPPRSRAQGLKLAFGEADDEEHG
jgi:hypothetical protein